MKLLETWPGNRVLVAVTLLALVAALVVRAQFAAPEQVMQAHGYGIVAYELAYSPQQADTILRAWGPEVVPQARRSLLVDFAFMPAYALLLAGITLLITRRLPPGIWRTAGLTLALAPFISAVSDALENLMLLRLLGTAGSVPALPPLVAGLAATVKFGLLIVVILFWLTAAVGWLVRRLGRRGRDVAVRP
jgi:hypothetical protein